MEKYYLKEDGKEVNIGDYITRTEEEETELGFRVWSECIEVTENNVNKLVEKGILSKKGQEESLDYYIDKISKRAKWPKKDLLKFFDKLNEVDETAALKIILKQIAIECDKKYDKHIRDAKEIWIISTDDWSVRKLNYIPRNFKGFSAFRSFEDANFAHKVCWPIIKTLIDG